MTALQNYLFRQTLAPLAAILSALTAIAVLSQGLTQLDIIVDQHSSGLTYLWVTLLAVPQLLALIMPLAIFFAVAYAMNRLHTDSELVVAFAAGVGPWQIIAPIFRLAMLAGLFQLAVALLVQPAAYKEMRAIVYAVRSEVAGLLVRDGAFNTPTQGVTLYARNTLPGGVISDLLIHDSRNRRRPITYTARTGVAAVVEGKPALVLRDGQILQPKSDGGVDLLDFDQYVLQFGDVARPSDSMVLKPSDRYLFELFAPNLANYYDQQMVKRFAAEAHGRMSGPLLNLALAMIAAAALLVGDFNRRGYAVRLAYASGLALIVRLLALGLQAAARNSISLNGVQYAFPLVVTVIAAMAIILARRRPKYRHAPPEANLEAVPA
jgi:lipopolysaccharide export system permease protein